MDFYGRKNLWKFILFVFAVLIGAATLWYTETFLEELRQEEIKKVEQFAEAMNQILNSDTEADLSFEQSIMRDNTTIPIILTDSDGTLLEARNIDEKEMQNEEWVREKLADMEAEVEPFEIRFGQEVQYLYYQNSTLLTKLRYYPLILLLVISLFVVIAYIAFSNARKSEQNQVWNGLAKETAHQIGTPLTSLMGWLEYLRSSNISENVVGEMEKDILRLNTITDRFSKIGSKPSIHLQPIVETTREAVAYLQSRSPKKIKVSFEAQPGTEHLQVALNKPLFEWVIENLIRNAIDALEGNPGSISLRLSETNKYVKIEVEDTGKGIPANRQKSVFRPGFTTKRRGWGLGLSLAKRIIEEYHRGRIFVARTELGKGTTFRILLKK